MKVKFEVELNMHEKITYGLNTRQGEDVISDHDKQIVHGRVEKIMGIFSEDR